MQLTNHRHPYHLVDASPWPLLASVSAFIFAVGLINSFKGSATLLGVGLLSVLLVFIGWNRDIVSESLSGS